MEKAGHERGLRGDTPTIVNSLQFFFPGGNQKGNLIEGGDYIAIKSGGESKENGEKVT